MPDNTVISQAPAFIGATSLSGGVVPFTTAFSAAPSDEGLSAGAKARIGVAVAIAIAVVVVTALAAFSIWRRKRSQRISYTKKAEAFPAKRGLGLGDAMTVVEVVPVKDVGGRLRGDERRVN